MVNICAKVFKNPPINDDEVMVQTKLDGYTQQKMTNCGDYIERSAGRLDNNFSTNVMYRVKTKQTM